jgi:hypothetical protein
MLSDVSVLPLQESFFLDRDWSKSFHVFDPLCYFPELKNSAGNVNSDIPGWHMSYLYTGGLVSNWRLLFALSDQSIAVAIKWEGRFTSSISFSQIEAGLADGAANATLITKEGSSVCELFASGHLKVGEVVRNMSRHELTVGVVERVFPPRTNERVDLRRFVTKVMGQGLQPVRYITLEDLLAGNVSEWLASPIKPSSSDATLLHPRYGHSFSAGLGWDIQAEMVLSLRLQQHPLFSTTELVYRNSWEDRLFSSPATVDALSNARFIDFELPGHSPAASEWPSMRALLAKLPMSNHLEWLDEHHAQFDADQATDPKNSDPCHTYLQGVESGTEASLDSLLLKYTKCHAAMLRGESEPRFLVFRWNADSDIGFGNMVAFMTTALLHAIVFRRAFLIDHESFRHDLRKIFESPTFDWELRADSIRLGLGKSLKTALIGSHCRELVEDTAPVLVVDVSPCVTMTAFITDHSFRKFLPLFPSRQPALMVGALSHVLFQPGLDIRQLTAPIQHQWQDRIVIGIAVRHSTLPDDHMMFIDNLHTVDMFETCASELALTLPNASFFVISDVISTKEYLTSVPRFTPIKLP